MKPAMHRNSALPGRLAFLAAVVLMTATSNHAGLFPKLMRHVPKDLWGDYSLLLKMDPEGTKQIFTNSPPFATVFSNRVVTASGLVRAVNGVIKVSQKGTNVFMLSFEGKGSWMMTPAGTVSTWVLLEPKEDNSKKATTFVVERKR